MNEDLKIIFDLARDSMSSAISHLEKKLLNIRALNQLLMEKLLQWLAYKIVLLN